MALLVVLHALVHPDTLEHARARLLTFGALERDRTLGGEWWRLLAAAALHRDVAHLLGNAAGLLVLGSAVVAASRVRWFLLVLVLSAVAGNLAQLVNAPPGMTTVGASGAVFGLLGCLVRLRLHDIQQDHRLLRRREYLRLFGFALLALLAVGRPGQTAWLAHAGGFVAGVLLAPIVRRPRKIDLALVGDAALTDKSAAQVGDEQKGSVGRWN